LPSIPARENTNGREEITLLPKQDFTQKTTPNVIRYNEIRSSICCQIKDITFSFMPVVGIEEYMPVSISPAKLLQKIETWKTTHFRT
jgi:hypothetical protein